MKEHERNVRIIMNSIQSTFKTMGGGGPAAFNNPVSAAMKNGPLVFALGVNVKEVVEHILYLTK